MKWHYDREYETHELCRDDGWEIARIVLLDGIYRWETLSSFDQGRTSNLRSAKRQVKEQLTLSAKKDLVELENLK